MPPFELKLPVDRSVLDNGLELIVVPDHTAPLVNAMVAFRVGSSVEDDDHNGYSHLFEHMMFQGSRAVPDSQDYRDQLNALGVQDNAYTSVDEVAYYFSAPAASLEPALDLMAGALRDPALDTERLEKEREVVLSEADLAESEPTYEGNRIAREALFGNYAGRLDPLGSRAVVSSVSRDDLQAMHERYYVPNNALLVLTGDLSREQGRAVAERYFGDWARGKDRDQHGLPTPPPFQHSEFAVVEADVSRTYIDLRWRGPSQEEDPEGVLAGRLLAMVTLLPEHNLRTLVGQYAGLSALLSVRSFRQAGYVQIALSVPFGNEGAVLRRLESVLSELGEPGDIDGAMLDTACGHSFRTYLGASTTPNSLPFSLAREFGVDRALAYFDRLDQTYALDTSALRRFVRRYMRGKPRTIVLTSSPGNIAGQRLTRSWLRQETQP
jgi:predicted Zn-dependent peptidase